MLFALENTQIYVILLYKIKILYEERYKKGVQ